MICRLCTTSWRRAFDRLVGWALLLASTGCAPLRSGEMTAADIETAQLGFLTIGATTKEQVLRNLGPPTFLGAKEGVWGYRMTLYSGARHTPDSYGWVADLYQRAAIPNRRVQTNIDTTYVTDMSAPPYEVVLVFDEGSKLKRFRIFRPYPIRHASPCAGCSGY